MSARRRRILVLEDEWIVAMDTQDLLESAGFEVVGPVASVREALALLQSAPVDAAVLDVHLTREMSFPVAEALIACATPFVFVSGFARADLPPRFREHPLLSKPVVAERLLAALDA